MGKESFSRRIRRNLASIGWKLFIWADYRGDEEAYFKALMREEEAFGRIKIIKDN